MNTKHVDLSGQVFGRLTVVGYSHYKEHSYWVCRCECGEHCTVRAGNLRSGATISCGCYQRGPMNPRRTTHGMRRSSEYNIWQQMIQRCNNPNAARYNNYGGRGITVCDGWLQSFDKFYKDMGPRPSKDHSLDRNDNDGPYSKENCRWATSKEQCNNQRSNRLLTHNGETQTMSEWSISSGIPYGILKSRILRGWDVDRAITEPVRKHNKRGDIQ